MYTDFKEYDYSDEEEKQEEKQNNENFYDDNNDDKKFKFKKILFIILILIIIILAIFLIFKLKTNGEKNELTETVKKNKAILVISRKELSLKVNESSQLEVSLENTDNQNPKLIWSTDNSDIVSVDQNGNIQALKAGSTDIWVTYEDEKLSEKCVVTVDEEDVQLESISFEQHELTLKVDNSFLLNINVNPSNAKFNEDDLIFESEDENVAIIYDKKYVKAVGNGMTTIHVKLRDKDYQDSLTLIVDDEREENVTINPTNLILNGLSNGIKVGQTSTIQYVVEPSTTTNKEIYWVSSDESIATVKDGIITGRKVGKCLITGTTLNGISKSMEIEVLSNEILVSQIKVDETDITMKVNGTKRLKYQILPSNSTNQKVAFSSSNSSVVMVDSNGILAAKAKGTVTITIKSADGNASLDIRVSVS